MSENPISALSVIVPVFNEAESLPRLLEALTAVLTGLPYAYEIILVNDGSTDNSLAVMRSFGATHPEVKVVDFRRNFGQTAAMMAGIDHARGDVIVPIDADLQNDPADIPRAARQARRRLRRRLRLAQGPQGRAVPPQAVSRDRQPADLAGLRRAPARLRLHAQGLPPRRLKACSSTARCTASSRSTQLAGRARHRARGDHHRAPVGKSKYGLGRIFKVVLDLIVVQFLASYSPSRSTSSAASASLRMAVSLLAFLLGAVSASFFEGFR